MKKSSVLVPARNDGSQPAAKLTVAKAEKPSNGGEKKVAGGGGGGGNLLMKKLLAKNKADEATQQEEDGGKRQSIAPGSSGRPSISVGSGSRLSLVGLMASRRFAKKLMNRAMEKRESTLGDQAGPTILYEPTYQMEPKARFEAADVLAIVKDVIDGRVKEMRYNPRLAPNMNRILGDEVKEKVKKLKYHRYKIVVIVMIGEKKGQGIMVSSRCSWDDKLDSYVTHTCQNKHVFCTCSVYGTYKE